MTEQATPSLNRLRASLDGLNALGDTMERRRSRAMVIDSAWAQSDGMVTTCAQHLGVSYAQTLVMLNNPVINHLADSDPRCQALQQVLTQHKLTPNTLPMGPVPSKADTDRERTGLELAKKGMSHGGDLLLESLAADSLFPPDRSKTRGTDQR
jgi:hypothetical protein